MRKGTKHSVETINKLKLYKPSEEQKKKISETLKNKFRSGILINPFKGKKHSEKTITKLKMHKPSEEQKKKIGETLKRKYKSGEIIHPFKGKKHSKKSIEKMSISHKNMSEDTRKLIGLAAKGRPAWNKGISPNLETIKKGLETKRTNGTLKHTEEAKRKISINNARYWKGKKRALEGVINQSLKVSGENSNFWKGGKSFEEYSKAFKPLLKNYIRNIDNYTCQMCNIKEETLKYKLSVHHIDYNKKNCSINNLICLCRSCHAKTSIYREKYKYILMKKRDGNYDKSIYRFLQEYNL